jgi:hypothetical protein
MDATLPSPALVTANEFGYCPRTPISNAVNDGPQSSIEVREVFYRSLSSSPARKKSRFFDTLRLKSLRKANITVRNESPKSLGKRKSLAELLPFSSMRSRRGPDSDNFYHSFHSKKPKATSPSKKMAVLRRFTAPILCVPVLTCCRRCIILSIEPTKEHWRNLGLYLQKGLAKTRCDTSTTFSRR